MADNANRDRTLVVWEGEWPRVKAGVSQARESVTQALNAAASVLDMPMYVALARRYTDTTDRYVTSLAMDVHANLQRHDWVARTAGLLVTSSYVMARSTHLGAYKMARNGFLTSVLLFAVLFPAEIAHCCDHHTWFGTRELSEKQY